VYRKSLCSPLSMIQTSEDARDWNETFERISERYKRIPGTNMVQAMKNDRVLLTQRKEPFLSQIELCPESDR